MYNLCLFAGTTEGRELAEFLSTQPVRATVCVATDYGETLIRPADNLTVSARRLTEEDMKALFADSGFDLVVDATHPYAPIVTENIRSACAATGTEYLRLLRDDSRVSDGAVYVSSIEEAVDYLNTTEGNILLTTGSKELAKYAGLRDLTERVYARVLPMDASLEACRGVGLPPARILAMQGPFSEEMNIALLHSTRAAFLVTKDGGANGGFAEKAAAAEKTGTVLVVIGRPPQLEGKSFSGVVEELCSRFGCVKTAEVAVVGIGPGSTGGMTQEVRDAIANADCLIGAKRMLEAVAQPGQAVFAAIAPGDIAAHITAHREFRRFAVVMSGDTGFFSGTKKLLPLLASCRVRVLPGLSSLSCLCARLGKSYEDVKLVSLHGRERSIARDVRANGKVFALVGGEKGINNLCRSLCEAGLGHVQVSIGEKLSYPDEKVTTGTAAELAEGCYETLSAALIENDAPDAVVTHGLPDEAFLRGEGADGVVPMTKSEVRTVCLSKLRLTENAVCWDIGAGTGSVAIEMALQARNGQVYAIERKEAAVELLRQNKERFGADNLTVVSGLAPEACRDLPAPTHAFIGGSSGNMKEIITLLLEKNPAVRIVATAIALESVGELTDCLHSFGFAETEVVSMSIAKSRKAGRYNLMTGNNPIYIFTLQNGGGAQ